MYLLIADFFAALGRNRVHFYNTYEQLLYYILLKYEMEICVAKIQDIANLLKSRRRQSRLFFCKSKYMGLIRHGLCNYLHLQLHQERGANKLLSETYTDMVLTTTECAR